MRPEPSLDKQLYSLGWSCIAVILIYVGLRTFLNINLINYIPPCIFHKLTGFYCLGCGGTRAVFAFARGDFLRSLFFHPFVPYAAVLGGWFMISQTIERISKGKLRIGLHFRMIYVWIALGLVAFNFLWKNGVLLFTGVALM